LNFVIGDWKKLEEDPTFFDKVLFTVESEYWRIESL